MNLVKPQIIERAIYVKSEYGKDIYFYEKADN
jgi:hypothetical protein